MNNEWRPIETAPKDGTDILGYRNDCGVIMIRWATAGEFMADSEIESCGWEEDSITQPDWFAADFIQGLRLDGDLEPTHWMPLPEQPKI